MKEPGPFDRMLESSASQDRSARLILIGMGILGLILLVLVLPPFSVLSGGGDSTPGTTSTASRKLPKVPEGYEALSSLMKLDKPKASGPSIAGIF